MTNVQMISIHLNKHNIDYVKKAVSWSEKHVVVIRIAKSLLKLLRCNTLDLRRKQFRFSTHITPEIWYSGIS